MRSDNGTNHPELTRPQPDGRARSLVELNIAVLLFAGTSLFAKIIPLPVTHIIFGRSAVAALAILVYSVATRASLRPARRGDLRVLIGLGVILAVHWITYFQAVRVSTVAIGTISLHTYPIITVLVEPMVDRTRLRATDAALAFVVLAGIVILVPELSLTSTVSQGVLWGVVSAVLFTARNLVVRRFVQRYTGATLMLYQTAVSAIVLLPYMLLARGLPQTIGEWPLFLLLGTVFTALTQSLYAGSLRTLPAKTVAIIATLLPLYSAVLATFVLGEVPAVRTIIGGLVVVGAVMVETVRAAAAYRRATGH
jgi:drug/metabolite transporter (DMT)-like permease